MIQIKDGEIIQYNLPKTGFLSDGTGVSGYDILMRENPELAKEEGWLQLEDNPPNYNLETQYLLHDGYEILEDKVVVKYKVEDIIIEPIEPHPSEMEILKAQNKALVDRQEFLEDVIAEMAMMIYD